MAKLLRQEERELSSNFVGRENLRWLVGTGGPAHPKFLYPVR